jgi:RNA polymerase sigma-70 factor (ECF subfamily)
VLQWKATEVADLLDTTVASVNSALQRARATLADQPGYPADPHLTERPDRPGESEPPEFAEPGGRAGVFGLNDADQELLNRYVDAFEQYDIEALVLLLRDDATLSMPPYNLWVKGPLEIGRWMLGPGAECVGSRLVPAGANGLPAFGQYRASGPGGRHEPWALMVLDIRGGQVIEINAFLDTPALFPLFGLPAHLDS